MQEKTREKIKAIQEMIDNGVTEKEIIKMKFKSSPKAYNEWLGKFGEHLNSTPKEAPREIVEVKKEEVVISGGFIPTEKEMIKLKNLLDNADDLLALLNGNHSLTDDMHEINVLEVPDELLKMYDVKISSLRLSKAIEDRFNKFVEKNKKYSKTSLINMALVEFLDKYE